MFPKFPKGQLDLTLWFHPAVKEKTKIFLQYENNFFPVSLLYHKLCFDVIGMFNKTRYNLKMGLEFDISVTLVLILNKTDKSNPKIILLFGKAF